MCPVSSGHTIASVRSTYKYVVVKYIPVNDCGYYRIPISRNLNINNILFIFLHLLLDERPVIEVIDLHSSLDIRKRLSCNGLSILTAFLEDLINTGNILFPLLSSLADGRELLLKHLDKELLNLNITQATALIMILKFIKILIIRQELLKVLRLAERIKISKYRISLNLAGILNLDMIRVGVLFMQTRKIS